MHDKHLYWKWLTEKQLPGIVNEIRIIYFAFFFSFILILLSYSTCCTRKYKKVKIYRGFLVRLINNIIYVLSSDQIVKNPLSEQQYCVIGVQLFMGHCFFNNNNKLCFISYIVYPEVIRIMNVQPIKGISTHLRKA